MTIQAHFRAGAVAALITLVSAGSTPAQEAWMIVKHEVADYERWKEVFDGALSIRRSVGELASYEMRCGNKDTLLTVWFEWDTFENATRFANDATLAAGIAAAGVVSDAEITIERIEKPERHVASVGPSFAFDLPVRLTVVPDYGEIDEAKSSE